MPADTRHQVAPTTAAVQWLPRMMSDMPMTAAEQTIFCDDRTKDQWREEGWCREVKQVGPFFPNS